MIYIIVFLLIIALWYFETNNTLSGTYPNVSESLSREAKGEFGELKLINQLMLLPGHKHILHHVYIPKGTDGWTEIDVILISQKGIAVLENKHYAGVLYGNISDKIWQHLFDGKRYEVYSPYRQNLRHITALIKNTDIKDYKEAVYGIVTLSNNEDFTIHHLKKDENKICHITRIRRIISQRNNHLNDLEIDNIYRILSPYMQSNNKNNPIYFGTLT